MKILLIVLTSIVASFSAFAENITLTSDNTLVLNDVITSESVMEVMQEAKKLDARLKSGYPIYLFLYTPGGSIQAGVELIEFLENLNRPVHTVNMFAASMGFQIAQHLGTRYITRYGVLMSHKARGSFDGEFGGTLSQIDTRYGMWIRRLKLMDEQTVKRTNGKQTLKSYTTAYSPELWLNGKEAVEQGYADKVVGVRCDDSLNKVVEKSIDLGFIKVRVKLSTCPLQTGILGVETDIVTNKGIMDLNKFLQSNGQFGGCVKEIEPSAYSYYTPLDQKEEDKVNILSKDLCAKDPSLTLDKIKKTVEDIRSKHSKDIKDTVTYSY